MSELRRDSRGLKMGRAAIVLALVTCYFGYVFQLQHSTSRSAGLGDWLDPYFINNLLESWRYSVTHCTNPVSPPMFFPATGTLGYSIGVILYAPVYIAARVWLDPFPAYTATLFFTMVAGSLCAYLVLRRLLSLRFLEALLVTAWFSTSGNVIEGSTFVWSQTASVFLIPPILLLGLLSAQRSSRLVKRAGLGLTGFLAMLLFTQDIYTAFLASLLGVLLLLAARVTLGARFRWTMPPRRSFSRSRQIAIWISFGLGVVGVAWAWIDARGSLLGFSFNSRHHHWERAAIVAVAMFVAWWILRGGLRALSSLPAQTTESLIAFGSGAAAGIVVFLYVYGAVALDHAGFPREQLMRSLQPRTPSDVFLLFTAPGAVMPYASGRSFAMAFGLVSLACVPWFPLTRRARWCAVWLALISAIVLLVAIQVHGLALWPMFTFLPGFSIIRDPKRIIYAYELVAALMLGWFVMELPRPSWQRRAMVVVLATCLVATWNRTTAEYLRPVDVFNRWVRSPIAVDPSCRSFFIKGASDDYMSRLGHMWALYANDSVFIAMQHDLPTLNGYSAWTPPGWDLANPQSDGYLDRVRSWIQEYNLQDVCALDIDARTMAPFRPAAALR